MITIRSLALLVPLGLGLLAGCQAAPSADHEAAGPSCLAAPSSGALPSGAPSSPVSARPAASPAGLSADPARSGPTAQDLALPDLTLQCLAGGRASLTEVAGPVIINLWASWCEPCQHELPAFREYHDRAPGAVSVIGVATRDSKAAAKSTVADHQLDFPTLWDPDGALLRAVGVVLLPATLVVSPDRRVVHIYNSTPLDVSGIARLANDYLGVGATP
jgi:peroxiredoxin